MVLASSLTQVSPGLIIWTIITFVVLAWVLKRFAWRPILDMVQEREKHIEDAVEAARRERAEAEKLMAEQKAAVNEARREFAERMRRNEADMEKFRDEQMAKARQEAESFKAEAQRALEDEKAKAIAEVKGLAADLAIDVASRLLAERMDDAKHRTLAEQYIEQIAAQQSGEVKLFPSRKAAV